MTAIRLVVALCLAGRFEALLCTIGVVCSSWSIVNLHTSQRDPLTPYGNCHLAGVRGGNRMVARTGIKPNRIYRLCYGLFVYKGLSEFHFLSLSRRLKQPIGLKNCRFPILVSFFGGGEQIPIRNNIVIRNRFDA